MVVLGWAVGKGSTAVDDWFQTYRHGPARFLLFFTDPRVLALMLVACVAVALHRRRWVLALVTFASPAIAWTLVQLLKPLFGRENDGALAYPSGHTTVMVVVLGMFLLVAGAELWAMLVAIGWCLLGMVGQGVTYHYFTDAVGALLLGTAIVGVAALTLRRAPHRT